MIAADLVRLLCRVPGAAAIFLQRDLEKLGSPLRFLARVYRRWWVSDTRVIAVAGSLGKTTTRRTLHAALACPDRKFSHSNYGAKLALNLLRVQRGDAHAAIEAGIGAPGYMAGYARMLHPDIVVMTSVRNEHFRSFPTLDHIRDEKAKIVSSLGPSGVAVLNGDDPRVRWMATQTRARVITFGLGEDNDVRAANLQNSAAGLVFDALLKSGTYKVRTRLFGAHMVYPCLAAIAVAELDGIPLEGALARLAELEPADSRMTLERLPNGITILDDSFKNGIDSLYAAIEAFAVLPATRKIAVLTAVEDPPGNMGDLNREIGRRLGQFSEQVIFIGSSRNMVGMRSGAVGSGMDGKMVRLMAEEFDPVVSLLAGELRPGDALLVKGRSTQRLRRIVLRLMGRPVACRVKYCVVKVASCDVCPLLNAPPGIFRNHFIARSVRE